MKTLVAVVLAGAVIAGLAAGCDADDGACRGAMFAAVPAAVVKPTSGPGPRAPLWKEPPRPTLRPTAPQSGRGPHRHGGPDIDIEFGGC